MNTKQFLADIHIPNTLIHIGEANNVLLISGNGDLEQFLKTNENKNLYFLANINEGKKTRANDDDIKVKKYVYFDFDMRKEKKDLTDQQIKETGICLGEVLKDTEYKNWSYIVFSGNGVHIYFVSNPTVIDKEFYSIGYDIMRLEIEKILGVEADRACRNVGRIARLPGSYNNKSEKKLVEIIASNSKDETFIERMQKIGETEKKRLEEIAFEEQALREHASHCRLYEGDDLMDKINQIPVAQEILKDFPHWSFNGKNFFNPDGSNATAGFVSQKNQNVFTNAGDSRFFPMFTQRGVGTYLYRREFSKLTPKETFEYFKREYPHLENEKTKIILKPKPEIKDNRKYTWGTDWLNKNFALIKRGCYCLLVADQGTGKTTFAFFQARKNAEMGNKTLYLSLEMDNDEIFDAFARSYSGITVDEEYEERIPEHKKMAYEKRIKELKSMDNLILSGVKKGTPISMDFIISELEKHNPDIIYIDNFDLIDRMEDKDDNKLQKQKSAKLMNIASTYQIPVMVIHHNRKRNSSTKTHQRTVDDVGGSGKITDDADRIVLISRVQDPQDELEKSILNLWLAKARGYSQNFGKVYFQRGDFQDEIPMHIQKQSEKLMNNVKNTWYNN